MKLIKKLPVVKNIFQIVSRLNELENQIIELECALNKQRHIQKYKNGEKINIVFICHRPQIWNTLKPLFTSCIEDSDFNVTIVAIPLKKQLPKINFNHEEYESEGAEKFWENYSCRVINGYDYENGKWFDLRELNPDYVFFQQPYNIAKCNLYKSWNVSKYATICYISYYYTITHSDVQDCMPKDFIKNVSLCFLQNSIEFNEFNNKFNTNEYPNIKRFLVGCPRFDNLNQYKNCISQLWKNKTNNSFKIVWTPRWTTNENNCHFFDYKDKFVDFCKNHLDVDFIFRPHPQAKLNYASENNFSVSDFENYEKLYEYSSNMSIDNTADYLQTFYSADVLISDFSSVIPEFFLTGKPIIYCKKRNAICDIEGNWTKGLYYAKNWEEIEYILIQLKEGNDYLKPIRQELISSEFFISSNGVGTKMKELIKKDFRGE